MAQEAIDIAGQEPQGSESGSLRDWNMPVSTERSPAGLSDGRGEFLIESRQWRRKPRAVPNASGYIKNLSGIRCSKLLT